MNPGSVEIVDRVSAVEAIKRLNEEDLLFLNRLIVERLKLISQARATTLMTSFTRGDRVGFQAAVVLPDNVLFEGGVGETLRRKLLTGMKSRTSSRICPASGFTRVRLAGAGQ